MTSHFGCQFQSVVVIESTHVAETRNATGILNGPYPVFSVIQKIDGVWKVTRSEYVLDPESGQARALATADHFAGAPANDTKVAANTADGGDD